MQIVGPHCWSLSFSRSVCSLRILIRHHEFPASTDAGGLLVVSEPDIKNYCAKQFCFCLAMPSEKPVL